MKSQASWTIVARSACCGVQDSSRLRLVRRRDELRGVAGPAGRHRHRDRVAGDLADDLDDLAVGEAGAVAEVEDPVSPGVHRVEGQQVGGGQVADVDVVADAGAVGGVVVVAEELELLAAAEGDLQGDRDEVGLRVVPLADHRPSGRRSAPATLK